MATGWWSSLLGGEPEASINRRELGLQQQEGPFGPGRLTLFVARTGRIDLHLSTAPGPNVPTIGLLHDAISFFRPLLLKWFGICPETTRVALGMVLIQPVTDPPSGYRVLSRYLRDWVRLDPDGSTEFNYCI